LQIDAEALLEGARAARRLLQQQQEMAGNQGTKTREAVEGAVLAGEGEAARLLAITAAATESILYFDYEAARLSLDADGVCVCQFFFLCVNTLFFVIYLVVFPFPHPPFFPSFFLSFVLVFVLSVFLALSL